MSAAAARSRSLGRFVRWRWLAASAAIWAVFGALTYEASRRPFLGPDLTLARWVQSVDWGPLTPAFPFINQMAGTEGAVVSALVVGAVALADWRAVPFAAVVEIGASQTYSIVNGALRAPRPAPGLIRITEHPGAYGWPSGHAGFALVQAALLVFAVAAVRPPRPFRLVVAVAGVLVVLAFVIQRVDAGVHWPSQTLGGLLVGAGWLTLAMSVRRLSDPVVAAVGHL
jgi:undecaprenyl-diphosphatase